ncbi:MAG: hypothetical protein KGJ07_08870 [Patescibacteria group bacterium]|nr:hypothetical protein [Patescibacteria group bacterium]
MNQRKHTKHIMRKESTTVEEMFISGSSMKKAQKRRVFRFVCVCKEVDVFYRQVNQPDMFFEEYSKPVKN